MNALIFRLLLVTVVVAPLPFGSVYPTAWTFLAVMSGLLLMAWSTRTMMGKEQIAVGLSDTWPILLLFSATIGYAALQVCPATPMAWHDPLWRTMSGTLSLPYRGYVSLDPGNTWAGIVRLCTYAAIFWLALQYGRDSRRCRQAITTVAIAATVYALYGLIEHISGTKTILWFPKHTYVDDVTSTFVNRNNFATFAGLGWLCVIASLYQSYSQWIKGIQLPSERLRATIQYFERRGWLYGLAMLLLAAALFASRSRGGLLSTLAGLVMFCLAIYLQRHGDKRLARSFGLVTLSLAAIFFVAGGRMVEQRLVQTATESDGRAIVYALTEEAIGDHLWLGTGLGTFEEAFAAYRLPSIQETYAQAHNTFLELLLELGFPGASALFLAVIVIGGANYAGALKRRRNSVYPSLGLGATVLVGCHALVDFSIQIPAVAVTYALILGVAMAQSKSSLIINGGAPPPLPATRTNP